MPFKVKHLPIPSKTESENSNLHGSLLMYMRPTELFKGTTFFTVYAKVSMQMILPLHLLGVNVALHSIFICILD